MTDQNHGEAKHIPEVGIEGGCGYRPFQRIAVAIEAAEMLPAVDWVGGSVAEIPAVWSPGPILDNAVAAFTFTKYDILQQSSGMPANENRNRMTNGVSNDTKNTALIAGATGAASKRLVEVLLADPTWSVVGLSRTPTQSTHERLRYVRADLMVPESIKSALADEAAITHAFYTSRAPFKEGGVEDVPANTAMLANMIDALELASPDTLKHIHLVEGSKWYGVHVGPSVSPAREDAARHMPPNFYYDQQDLLASRQTNQSWTWSASRPNVIYDFAPERTRNLVPTLGVWAAMAKEMGIPLDFPGRNFDNLSDMTDATHFAKAMKWMATADSARNQAFNATDGDFFRWRHLFKRIADHYDIELGQARPMNLTEWMADKQPLWDQIVLRQQLKPSRLEDIAAWGFADFLFNQTFDVVSSMVKIRQAGFHDTVATEDMFIFHLKKYQDAGILPH